MTAADVRPRRGQLLSWVALILALAAATAIGVGLASALDDLGGVDVAGASDYVTLAVVGLVVALASVVVAIVAVFRARPKLVATLALILSLFAPWVGAVIGAKFGADSLLEHSRHPHGLVAALVELLRRLFG